MTTLPEFLVLSTNRTNNCFLTARFFYISVTKEDEGTPLMKEIANHVKDGAMAYLGRQYKIVQRLYLPLFSFYYL